MPDPTTDTPRFDEGLASAPVFAVSEGRAELLGSTCSECAKVAFPARTVCLECGGAHERTVLSGRGTVRATTEVATPPEGFDGGFRYLAVDLVEGPRVLCLAAEDQSPAPGDLVMAVPGRVRGGTLGFRFALVSDD